MNRKRNIVIVSIISMVALILITGWNAAWPPQPLPVYSPVGSWTDLDGTGDISIITLGAPDLSGVFHPTSDLRLTAETG